MDPVDFLYQRAQQTWAAFKANPTSDNAETAHRALRALSEEQVTRLELMLKAVA